MGVMATNDTMTLVVSGDLSLKSFAAAVARFEALVRQLTLENAPKSEITWAIDDLQRSSAITAVRGRGDPRHVELVVDAFLDVGRSLEARERIRHSQGVAKEAERLARVIKDEVESIRFETSEAEAVVLPESAAELAPGASFDRFGPGAYGAVTGRVQTLSNRGGLRFTLYDLLHDKAVSCYLLEGSEEQMRDAWGRPAVVEGWVRRDAITGRPLTVRRIARVQVLPEAELGAYIQARGAGAPFDGDLSPEDAIRRVRDA